MRRGWGWRAADRRVAAGARARDGGEGSPAVVVAAGAAEGEFVRPCPPSTAAATPEHRGGGVGNGPARGLRQWGSRACRRVCGGVLLGPWGWAARAWSRPHPGGGRRRGTPGSQGERDGLGRPLRPGAGAGLRRRCRVPLGARRAQSGLGGATALLVSSGSAALGIGRCQGRGVEPGGRRGSEVDVGSAWFRFCLATCSSVGNNLERAPYEALQRENRRWVRSMAWAWLGLCEGKEKPLEKGELRARSWGTKR